MQRLEAFPPIAAADAHTLILGSMPGAASLAAKQYYAHPRNLFWPLIERILGIDATAPYAVRATALAARGYALWDVLETCVRPGSLDADIEPTSIEINDFAAFFAAHRTITRVFFNGAHAAKLFRHTKNTPLPDGRAFQLHQLPSTSPANASIPFERKLAAWRAILA